MISTLVSAILKREKTCGQSYKQFVAVNYDLKLAWKHLQKILCSFLCQDVHYRNNSIFLIFNSVINHVGQKARVFVPGRLS
jgi:hypothetical protein